MEAADDAVLAMLDKSRTYEIARSAGVGAPNTLTVRNRRDLALLQDFQFPCGIKPVESHVFARRFRPFAKGTRVTTAEEAAGLLGPIVDEGIAMLVTEMVEGTDECCSYYAYLDERGNPLTEYTKRKLRVYPVGFGLGTYHLSEWQPDVAALGLQFCRAAGLRGMANVEFKRDNRDGNLRIIECNARFTNAQEVVRRAGIDMGRLAYARAAGTPLPPVGSFRDNVGLLFLADDVRAFLEYRRRGELTTANWLRSLLRRQAPLFFDWRDPKPSFMNATHYGRGAARLVRRTVTGRRAAKLVPPDPYGPHDRSDSTTA
jgi:predicted ATP-grasp superfamily ATP-dependent carboligase